MNTQDINGFEHFVTPSLCEQGALLLYLEVGECYTFSRVFLLLKQVYACSGYIHVNVVVLCV